uniref:DUF1534 domain-containing protein n=1 Tax=Mesocestoides corti TaxID=53468 RepID=A0A5K3G367_MESCO
MTTHRTQTSQAFFNALAPNQPRVMRQWRRRRRSSFEGDNCDWLPGIAESTRHFKPTYCNRSDVLCAPAPIRATLLI